MIFPITITTLSAEATIKEAAEAQEDKSLYYQIKDLDLIAKEFKYHECCRRDFIRKKKSASVQFESERCIGNFDAVVECINERVMGENQALSMAVLHEIYGLFPKDTRYRSKLKKMNFDFPNSRENCTLWSLTIKLPRSL